MNADGSNVRQITNSPAWDEGPAWSPDGTKFAFSHGADDLHLDIWTMNRDGSDQRQLTTYAGHDESHDWGANPHPAGVGGTVPATLALQLPAVAPGLGTFTPGVARDYFTSLAATVASTAGNATLSASGNRLANGAYTLPQPLQIRAGDGAYQPLPATMLTYGGPVSNDSVTIGFKQPIGATDALRTGTYGTTVTLSLSTSEP